MVELDDLLGMRSRDLHALMGQGYAIEPASLDDREFHGVALGMPRLVEALTWKTFKKVFRRDPITGKLRGWNVAVEQRGVDGPFVDRLRRGQRVVYWPYEVHRAIDYMVPGPYHHGLMIDYGPPHGRLNPQHLIRDPLVALHDRSNELLLGYSYVDLGWGRLRTPTFFVLRPGEPLTYDAFAGA